MKSLLKAKFIFFALVLSLLLTLPVFTGCECEHLWDKGSVRVEPKGDEDGEMLYLCYRCGESKIEKYHTQHKYTNQWGSDETHHWLICDKEGCEVKTKAGEHTFREDGYCILCRRKK